uniref:Secreted protein n=1 Tax=Brassica oleracea TaxID=3712 RepID=A0A3P6EN16_BRAOL|nr:unnamed protein product [Brassica oleracea]
MMPLNCLGKLLGRFLSLILLAVKEVQTPQTMTDRQGLKAQKSIRVFWLLRNVYVHWTMTSYIYHSVEAN